MGCDAALDQAKDPRIEVPFRPLAYLPSHSCMFIDPISTVDYLSRIKEDRPRGNQLQVQSQRHAEKKWKRRGSTRTSILFVVTVFSTGIASF